LVLGYSRRLRQTRTTRQALKTLEQLQQTATRRYVWNYTFALVRIALGENHKAIDFLDARLREHADYELALLQGGHRCSIRCAAIRGFEALVSKVFAPKGN